MPWGVYETGIKIINSFECQIEKSVVITISNRFKLCQFGKVPDDDQLSSKPISKGFNFVNKNLLMNEETICYVDYKFNNPIYVSR